MSAFFASSLGTPKTQSRFQVSFPGLVGSDGKDSWWTIKSLNRPTVTVNKTEYNLLNHTFYYPGTVRWEPITMTLIDPIRPDITNSLMGMLIGSGYKLPSDATGAGTISKAASTVGPVVIKMFGTAKKDSAVSGGDIKAIETMTLQNAWIEQINFGELSYDSDEFLELELTLAYDWCTFTSVNDGATATSGAGALTTGASSAASALGGTVANPGDAAATNNNGSGPPAPDNPE